MSCRQNQIFDTKHGIAQGYTLFCLHGLASLWLTLPLPSLAALQDNTQVENQKPRNKRTPANKQMDPRQVNRLQNRVLLLQRELELLRGPSGRGHMEPMVPEKQFQQLSTAHGKASRERFLGVEISGIGGGGSKALLALVGKSGLVWLLLAFWLVWWLGLQSRLEV